MFIYLISLLNEVLLNHRLVLFCPLSSSESQLSNPRLIKPPPQYVSSWQKQFSGMYQRHIQGQIGDHEGTAGIQMTDNGVQIGFWSDSPAGRITTAAGSILNHVYDFCSKAVYVGVRCKRCIFKWIVDRRKT